MPLVCFKKETKEIVEDFQPLTNEDTLIKNAIAKFGGKKEDYVVVPVSEITFNKYISDTKEKYKAENDQELLRRKQMQDSVISKLKKTLKLTDEEIPYILKS